MLDPKDTVIKKFRSAVTDSGSEVRRGEDKPGINNLMDIYNAVNGKTDEQICKELGTPKQVAAQYLTPAQLQESVSSNSKNKTLYMIVAIVLTVIFVAIAPAALGCIAASAFILIASIISGVAASSWILFGLLFSISLLLFSLGVLIILISIAIIRFCWKRSVG